MSSGSETGPIRECAGEIDRCWWAALGAHNFLSKMHSRYTSFRFQTDNKLDPRRQKTFEGVMTSGDELRILRTKSVSPLGRMFNVANIIVALISMGSLGLIANIGNCLVMVR